VTTTGCLRYETVNVLISAELPLYWVLPSPSGDRVIRKNRYDLYDGTGMRKYHDEQWLLSEEEKDTSLGAVIAKWDKFDDVPELLREKVSVIFVINAEDEDEEIEGVGHKWDEGGYTVVLTDDEIEELGI
jgi:hypothetical protein